MKKLTLIFVTAVASLSPHAQTGQTYTQMFDSLFSIRYSNIENIAR